MKTMMASTVLPRRLTQLFADTKKSYENIVQTRHDGPELSSLHLKLRIQKDRLIAWGIQWSDRSAAAQNGEDIDGLLDKAGIGDLVASIMSSIRELLDEAEGLQPSQPVHIPGAYGDMKSFAGSVGGSGWSAGNLRRLEEILKDLTTSIDTLCDLSRSRVEDLYKIESSSSGREEKDFYENNSPVAEKSSYMGLSVVKEHATVIPTPSHADDLTYSVRIAPSYLRFKAPGQILGASPPSYESIATSLENRALAYLSSSILPANSSKSSTVEEVPVLLDYGPCYGNVKVEDLRPVSSRFEELLLSLLKLAEEPVQTYTGILQLQGWSVDAEQSRCAYVYKIPSSEGAGVTHQGHHLQPRSLLSFLQNGGDTDINNMPSLENRFQLAFNVASNVNRVHGMGVTHRNVNSDNIVFFLDANSASVNDRAWKGPIIRKPYLTAFNQLPLGYSVAEDDRNFSGVYHYPGLVNGTSSSYTRLHDYYSLGLVLLEIGLWMPIGKFWKSKYTRRDFKSRLQDIYLKKLAAKCGTGYMNAVLYCMTAADENPAGYHDGRSSGQISSMAESTFQSEVIQALSRCCLIEKNADPDSTIAPHLGHSAQRGISQRDAASQNSEARDSTNGHVERMKPSSNADQRHNVSVSIKQKPLAADRPPSTIKVWSHDLPALYTKYWASTMFPKLERILSKAISRWESYTVDLFMAGEAADTARPTVYMECTSTSKVRKILRHLNKDLRLFEIKVVPGQIVRSKAGKKNRKNKQKVAVHIGSRLGEAQAEGNSSLNPHYQEKPACGASIGVFRNGSHLPPVSFGGAVLVDGEPFGMSVHHMLEDDEEDQFGLNDNCTLQRSMAPRPSSLNHAISSAGLPPNSQDQYPGFYAFQVSECPEGSEISSGRSDYSDYSSASGIQQSFPAEAIYPFEISEDGFEVEDPSAEDDEFWLTPEFENELARVEATEDDCMDLGDTLGIDVGRGQDLIVTQPAIDDVDQNFFPTEEDKNDEHLSSHALGHIHASSGIKRSRRDEIIHEVDWALIKIDEHRMHAHNIIQGGAQYCKFNTPDTPHSGLSGTSPHPDSYPHKVKRANDLGGLNVHALGRTSGLQTGTILPAMRMVRMPGRSFASHSWQVRGNFGGKHLFSLPETSISRRRLLTLQKEGGDSGAWVIDNATNHICGHVLAWSPSSNVAYIAPMEVLLEDMAETLAATVTLPDPTLLYRATPKPQQQQSQPPALPPRTPSDTLATSGLRREDSCPSPAMPTSPPALVHELSGLSLTDMGQEAVRKASVEKKVGKDISGLEGRQGSRGKGRAMGMVERRGPVSARG